MEKPTEYIKGLGHIYQFALPFHIQLQRFRSVGISAPVSVRDASYIRLHGTNKDYTRTCHAPICAKDSPTILARLSPLVENLEMAEQAVNAHRDNKYPVFDDDNHIYSQWEKIANNDKKKKPENRNAIILPQRSDCNINLDSDEARFLFQNTRIPYFKQFVKGDSIPCWQIPTKDIDSASGTIINYAGFYEPVSGSDLDLRLRYLYFDLRALGVLNKGGEAAQKISLPYTQKQLNEQIRNLERIGLGDIKMSDLESKVERVVQFLKSLKQ